MLDSVACHPFPPDFYHYIMSVLEKNGHGVVFLLGDDHYPIFTNCIFVSGFFDCLVNGFLVGNLS